MKVAPEKIIVALDFASQSEAFELVDKLADLKCRFKVGKEMFTRFGPTFVKQLIQKDLDVFLDLKFHDIPNTVYNACLSAAELGVWMLNVHALGGRKMMEQAVKALEGSELMLLAVTVLTSMEQRDLLDIGCTKTPQQLISELAILAKSSGIDGVVCSARECSMIKMLCGKSFLTVTPGIRPENSVVDDQKRVLTPHEAIREGSDYIVIGRPITKAQDPRQVLLEIIDSSE